MRLILPVLGFLALALVLALYGGNGSKQPEELNARPPQLSIGPGASAEGLTALAPKKNASLERESEDPKTERVPMATQERTAMRDVVLRVLSETTRRPLAGARVRGDWDTLTDNQGFVRYSAEADSPPTYGSVRISADGFVSKEVELVAGQWETETFLTPGVVFDLRVTDSLTGEALGGVRVRASQSDDEENEREMWADAVTNENGVASFPAVHRGYPVSLRPRAKGYLMERFSITVDEPGQHAIELGAGGRVHARLLGPDGVPVEGVAVEIHGPMGQVQTWWADTATDGAGNVSLAGLRLGRPYFLKSVAPRARSAIFTPTEEEPEHWVQLRCEPDPPVLQVQVRDEMGEPWNEVRVTIERRVPLAHGSWPGAQPRVRVGRGGTGDKGDARIELDESGNLILTLSRLGGPTVVQEFSIDPGQVKDLELVYPRGLVLEGILLDENRKPIPEQKVTYGRVHTKTDMEGKFECRGLVSAANELVFSSVSRDAETGPELFTWLRFDDIAPTGERLEFQRSAPVGLSARFVPPLKAHRVVWTLTFGAEGTLDTWGDLEVDPSTQILVASNASTWGVSVHANLPGTRPHIFYMPRPAPGTLVDLGELDFDAGRTISGQVLMPDLSPAVGVAVELGIMEFDCSLETSTDADGFYRFDRVPSADGYLWTSVEDSLGRDIEGQAEFGKGVVPLSIDILLGQSRYVRVSGTLRWPDTTVVQHARIRFQRLGPDHVSSWTRGTGSKPDGSFQLKLEPGTYQVMVQVFGDKDPILGPIVEIKDGDDVELRLAVDDRL